MPDTAADLSATDLGQLARSGIAAAEVERQLRTLRRPSAPPRLRRPCRTGDGIVQLHPAGHPELLARWRDAAAAGRLMKFVPASGAASRMFAVFERRLEDPEGRTLADLERSEADLGDSAGAVRDLLANLESFAFHDRLAAALARDGLDLATLRREGRYLPVLRYLLTPVGLGYAGAAKGLIDFHRYPRGARTAFEEHLVEAIGYLADAARRCRFHFTVAPDQLEAFERARERARREIEEERGARLEIDFSLQSPSTDTVSLDASGRPFRLEDGSLLLRPSGHGALLGNLAASGGDLVFVKNVDNLAPERMQEATVLWKRLLAGHLLVIQGRIFEHFERLDEAPADAGAVDAACDFIARELAVEPPAALASAAAGDRRRWALARLARPLRVCGMVRHEGKPGGGPFWVEDADGGASGQIIESAQIDADSRHQTGIWESSTHFNPVDLVCALRDRAGDPWALEDFVEPGWAFVSRRAHGGRPLLALERPGLWNGGMGKWSTVFVEVPQETFNDVKVVLDLLRPEHRA